MQESHEKYTNSPQLITFCSYNTDGTYTATLTLGSADPATSLLSVVNTEVTTIEATVVTLQAVATVSSTLELYDCHTGLAVEY